MSVLLARGVPSLLAPEDLTDRHGLLLSLSGARVIVVGPGHEKVARVAVAAAGVEGIRIVEAHRQMTDGEGRLFPLDSHLQVRSAGEVPDVDTSVPEDIATLIFTSGTTGIPKAVRLSHRVIVSSLAASIALAPIGVGGNVLSFLPMSHVGERFMNHYQGLAFGLTVHSVPDPDILRDEIRRIRPSRFFAVPRVYEKLAAVAWRRIDEAGLRAVVEDSLAHVRTEQVAGQAGDGEGQATRLAALAPSRRALSLEQAEYRGVATAPSSPEILELFSAIGLPVGNIWGMSEAIM
jgi:long-chain acyl-CoA synthetase